VHIHQYFNIENVCRAEFSNFFSEWNPFKHFPYVAMHEKPTDTCVCV